MTVSSKVRGESGTVGTGTLDSERDNVPEACCPLQKLSEAVRVGSDCESRQDPSKSVHRGGDVDVLMRIDTDDDVT